MIPEPAPTRLARRRPTPDSDRGPRGAVVLAALSLVLGACRDGLENRAGRPNLLLVTLDTLRADRLGCYGHGEARTPALDGLAERGVLFREAYSPAPMTLPAHATLMTGLLPPQHGARVNGLHRLPEDVPTLAAELSAAGYRTGAFVAAFVLDSRFGLDRGFDRYDDDLSGAYPQEVAAPLSTYRPGDRVVDAALEWLDGGGKDPFFAWVHLYDAHFPWFSTSGASRRGCRARGPTTARWRSWTGRSRGSRPGSTRAAWRSGR